MKIPKLKYTQSADLKTGIDPLDDISYSSDDLLKYMNEFDIKDIPNSFTYTTSQEQKLAYNMVNAFKLNKEVDTESEQQKELLSKLEDPSSAK